MTSRLRPDAADVPELAPLWRALARGTKRTRLRSLVVVCGQGHTLLEVFPAAGGAWAVAQDHDGREYAARVPEADALPVPVGAGVTVSRAPAPAGFPLSRCRCQDRMEMTSTQLRAALDAGERRHVIRRWSEAIAARPAN